MLSTTDLPTLVMVSRLTDLNDVCTFRDMSNESFLACWVSCAILKKISWAVMSSGVECWTGGWTAEDVMSAFGLIMLDGGEEQRGVAIGVGGLGPLCPPECVDEVGVVVA